MVAATLAIVMALAGVAANHADDGLFWSVQPARQAAGAATQAYIGGTTVLNRTMWKYQDWLAGYNGGPLRAPAMRIPDGSCARCAPALQAASLPVTDDPTASSWSVVTRPSSTATDQVQPRRSRIAFAARSSLAPIASTSTGWLR